MTKGDAKDRCDVYQIAWTWKNGRLRKSRNYGPSNYTMYCLDSPEESASTQSVASGRDLDIFRSE